MKREVSENFRQFLNFFKHQGFSSHRFQKYWMFLFLKRLRPSEWDQMLQLAAARPQELVGKVIGRGVFNRFPSFILCLFNLCEGEQRCLGSASTGPTKASSTSLTTTTRMIRGFLRKYGRHSEWLLGKQFSQDFISNTLPPYLCSYITIQGVCQCSQWVWCSSTAWAPRSWETAGSPASMTLSRLDVRWQIFSANLFNHCLVFFARINTYM